MKALTNLLLAAIDSHRIWSTMRSSAGTAI